jgi:hypothetical protein
LDKYGKADAAAPPSSAVVTSKDFSIVQKDKQKVAGCLFGVCVNLPQIPGVTGGDPLGVAKTAIVKQIGEAVGVGSPLLLDQKTAYPDVSDQVKDFHPQKLTITSAEDLQKPLPPGDYSLDVIAYCTQFSIHAPGRGLPYKLAPLMGKQAPAISALLSRGTLQGIAPATLNANAWRIQAGLPLKQWSPQDQALIHKLIPEYEKGLEGDYLQQIENTYNQYRIVPGIPSLNDLLKQSGAPGQLVLQLRQARQTLADQTISAERLPDMLYEPTGDGLPRVLPPSKDSSPSPWAEIQPGVFARFTVIEGNLGKNLFEFRVTPKAIAAINHNSNLVATKELDKKVLVSEQTGTSATPGSVVCYGNNISHPKGPAQALISACVSDVKADDKEPLPEPGDVVIYRASNGNIIHSGIITGVRPDGTVTQVESKWQAMGLYIHDPNESVYGMSWTVWRANRKDGSHSNLLKKGRYRLWVKWYTDSAVKQDGTLDTNDVNDSVADYSVIGGMPANSEFRKRVEDYVHSHKIQTVAPRNRNYNCHGFVFANGEESIDDTVVEKILRDNKYSQIRARDTNNSPH